MTDTKILCYVTIVVVLLLFTKLPLDITVLLGASFYFYQKSR